MYKTIVPMPIEGIDLLSPEARVPSGRARRIENADLHRDGTLTRRKGRTQLAAGSDFHSIRNTEAGLLVGKGHGLFRVDPADGTPVKLATLEGNGPFDFTDYAGRTYVLTSEQVYSLRKDSQVEPCGVALPATLPTAAPSVNGALPAGRYVVAITRLNAEAEESPAAILASIDLPQGGGIRIDNLPVDPEYSFNIYLTAPEGGVLRHAETILGVFPQYVATQYPKGHTLETRNLEPLPGGQYIRGYRGRLFVASGDTVWHSEPLRPHLRDRTSAYLRMRGQVTLLESVADGIYIGDDAGVWFLSGDDITNANMQLVSPSKVIAGSALRISTAVAQRQGSDDSQVVWLSENGYILGSNSGRVQPMNADRLRISPKLCGTSMIITEAGIVKVVTMTGVNSAHGYGLADRRSEQAGV